ncbi:MAG TPA: branched-chain amino acid ABC transporter permease/ATP-binding protein [Micromonosporaceae bacterium]|nr:branched-chain amino acid ABC transporter permease/ATP-binding protein [Micromonosporaceae bacterium]
MTELLQLIILGMATGGFYTIGALGLVVVFRSSGVINFAGGGTAMVGGYVQWQLADEWGWPPAAAVLGAVATSAFIGWLIYMLGVRPLAAAATLTQVIATLAILISIQQLVVLVFGGLPKVPESFLPTGSASIGLLSVGQDSLMLLAASCGLTFALWAAYRRTRFGLATSALAEAPRSLAALGWNITRLRAANWAIGGALAGLAGAALGPILQLTPGTFTYLLIPTLACAMIGGLKSFPLTLAGGLLVGSTQAVAGRYLTWGGVGDAIPFLLIIVALIVRGRSLPLRSFVHERLPRVGTGEISRARLLGVAAIAAVFPLIFKDDWVIGLTATMMMATILLSQVVITGFAGQLSLAQLTLGGVGAITAANVAAAYQAPFLVSLLVGMLAVIPVSILVGLPSLRARGVSLAIATLGLAVAINSVVLTNDSFNGGLAGLNVTSQTLFGWSIDATAHPRRYYLVVVVVFGLLATVANNVRRGRSGRRLLAVRNNERAAKALGIDVVGAKLYAFTLAGVIAGAGGVLMIFNQSIPQFVGFDPLVGLSTLLGAVIGGIGFISGAVIGGMFHNAGLPNAVLHPVVGELSWWIQFFPLATGVVLVIQLMVDPDGIAAGGRSSAAGRRGRAIKRLRDRNLKELDAVDPLSVSQRGASLHARNLRVVFGSVVALDGVDIDVHPGEVVSVIGPNGAGKTTLLDAITGFVPAAGSVELAGQRLDKLSAHRRARAGVGRSFQSLELFEDMTVMDNVRCASDPDDRRSLLLDMVHPTRGSLTPATAAAVEAFGLRDHLHRLPNELGYGDRRLVAIARTVAGSPAVLLLDEPAAGLAEFERAEVARLITTMAREWQLAIILIEHHVEFVRQVSDRVVALDFGRVIATGTPAEVLSHPDVVRAYLGTPAPPSRPASSDDENSPEAAHSSVRHQ